MSTAHAYCRVSTSKQGALGIDAQKGVIQTLYDKHLKDKYPSLAWYIDEDVSARQVEFKKRPASKDLDLRIVKGDCIIFAKFDRAFRSLRDTLNMLHYWDHAGIAVHCADFHGGEPFDSTSMTGKILVWALALCAEIEGDRAKQRMKDWSTSQAKLGRATGGKPHYGFKFVRHGPPCTAKGLPPAVVQPEPEELEVLDFIYKQQLRGFANSRIARHLNKNGFLHRGKPWHQNMVKLVGKGYAKIKAMEAKLVAEGVTLAKNEFISPMGVICKLIPEAECSTSTSS